MHDQNIEALTEWKRVRPYRRGVLPILALQAILGSVGIVLGIDSDGLGLHGFLVGVFAAMPSSESSLRQGDVSARGGPGRMNAGSRNSGIVPALMVISEHSCI